MNECLYVVAFKNNNNNNMTLHFISKLTYENKY